MNWVAWLTFAGVVVGLIAAANIADRRAGPDTRTEAEIQQDNAW